MNNKKQLTFMSLVILISICCVEVKKDNQDVIENKSINPEEDKKAILETLNNETKGTFQRDYNGWKRNVYMTHT